MKALVPTILLLSSVSAGFSQVPQQERRPVFVPTTEFSANRPSAGPTGTNDYRIGSNDFIVVEVYGEPTLTTPGRVSPSGTLSLQLLGPVDVAGLTPGEVERKVEAEFKKRQYINEPHVTVTVQEYGSQPVQILGAVRQPNVYQLKGEKNLLAMIAVAGGLSENVGPTIQIMRGGLSKTQSSSENGVLTVSVDDFQRSRIGLDIPIYADDAIYVSSAESVFALGEFIRPNELILKNGKALTVVQAISQVGGFTRDARRKEAVLIRIQPDGTRADIPLDIDKILGNKAPDVTMLPNDIFYVPANKAKAAVNRTLEGAISVVTGRLIYRF